MNESNVKVITRGNVKATLYLGDCRDLLPIKADAVVTDPPYGIGKRMLPCEERQLATYTRPKAS